MAGNPSFKQNKNIIAISPFVEKSCGFVVHTKNEYPTVPMLMLIVGEKQKHTRPVDLLSQNKYNPFFFDYPDEDNKVESKHILSVSSTQVLQHFHTPR